MKQFLVNAPARAGLALAACIFAAPTAMGQEAQPAPVAAAPAGTPESAVLVAEIERAASCTANRSLADIKWLIRRAEPGDVALAMATLSASPETCTGIKAAAAKLAQEFPLQAAVEPAPVIEIAETAPAAATASATVDPDEERRAAAAAMKFTIGEPPRRLTRGLAAGG